MEIGQELRSRASQLAWSRDMNAPRHGDPDIVIEESNVKNTPSRTFKGIPLGGFGAGSVMLNWTGSFGPFHMKPGRYEERFPAQGAFILTYSLDGEQYTPVVLSTEHVMSAWKPYTAGNSRYYGLYPKGWIEFENDDLAVSLLFFSPIIAKNYRETSYPVACFTASITNKRSDPLTARLSLAFPNCDYTGADGLRHDRDVRGMFKYYESLSVARSDLANRLVKDEEIVAVEMLSGADNPVETANTGWCIAAGGDGFAVDRWDSNGDGQDLLTHLTQKNVPPVTSLCDDRNGAAAAVGYTKLIGPHTAEYYNFALAWDFPFVQFGHGTVWKRRYTEFFPEGEGRLAQMASLGVKEADTWSRAVDSWTKPIEEDVTTPEWLRAAALNEIYYMSFGGVFWENGCVTKSKQFGAREDQHLFFVMECLEYPFAETFDVRHHASRLTRELWPQIERDILLAYSDFIAGNPTGALPHDAGSPEKDPYFKFDDYYDDYPYRDEKELDTTPWSEFSPKFIQQCHAYWKETGDDDFIAEVLPSMVKTYYFQLSTDINGDGLTEMKSSEYRDNHLFNAILWLGALRALLEILPEDHPGLSKDDVRAQLSLTREAVETRLWNNKMSFYQYNAQRQVIMGDAFVGQLCPLYSGLGYLVPIERLRSHLKAAIKYGVLPNVDHDGDGFGDVGVANIASVGGESTEGAAEFSGHDQEAWTGVSYLFAALAVMVARHVGDHSLETLGMQTAYGAHHASWTDEKLATWFASPEAISISKRAMIRAPMYQRARGIWELYRAVTKG